MDHENELLRVLLVEDNQDDADLIRRQIQMANGYELLMERVETEPEVRHALHKKSWDVIICDYHLPKLDALKVIEILDAFALDTVFILVSGKISEDEADIILGRGRVHEYVSKQELWRLGPVLHRELKIRAAYDETLIAFAVLLEHRDRETAGHSERVTKDTLALARKLKVSETEIVHYRRGALLHDIGKMAISDAVLLKPGKLTREEFEVMKQHPKLAYDALLPIQHLRRSLDIPYCHHEKWDGTGYPRGLAGREIPFSARIFSVADVYDAMTNDRPYRAGLPKEFVRQYVSEQGGNSFDPEIAEVFLEMKKNDTN